MIGILLSGRDSYFLRQEMFMTCDEERDHFLICTLKAFWMRLIMRHKVEILFSGGSVVQQASKAHGPFGGHKCIRL
jgi:hypothetical protein